MKAETMQTDETTLNLSEAECAGRLAPMWEAGDMHSYWPADSQTVCELLRSGGGFDCTIELLEGWARSQQVGPVRVHSGKFAWAPSNVLRAAALMNVSRRWVAMHPGHVHKMTGPELAEQQAAAVGETIFSDLDSVSCRSLLGIIASSADADLRATLCVALGTKLRKAGIT